MHPYHITLISMQVKSTTIASGVKSIYLTVAKVAQEDGNLTCMSIIPGPRPLKNIQVRDANIAEIIERMMNLSQSLTRSIACISLYLPMPNCKAAFRPEFLNAASRTK